LDWPPSINTSTPVLITVNVWVTLSWLSIVIVEPFFALKQSG